MAVVAAALVVALAAVALAVVAAVASVNVVVSVVALPLAESSLADLLVAVVVLSTKLLQLAFTFHVAFSSKFLTR